MALIQRSCIMLRQGLADIALSDLREGLDCLSRAEWQSREIGAILSRAVNIEPWIIPQQHHLISELTKTFRAKHYEAQVLSIVRGIYWAFLRSLRRHQWRNARQSANMLLLAALYGAPSLLARHIRLRSTTRGMS